MKSPFAAFGAVLSAALAFPAPAAAQQTLRICHGYGCAFKAPLTLTAADASKFRAILSTGARSAQAERTAIKKAVRRFENRAFDVIGIRDQPKSTFGASKIKGQMDCVDESTNTDAFLRYLEERGLLKHHRVMRKDTRGFLLDGRYPHWTAVIRDPGGRDWAVDSWYAPTGGPPDILPMSEWKKGGVLGGD